MLFVYVSVRMFRFTLRWFSRSEYKIGLILWFHNMLWHCWLKEDLFHSIMQKNCVAFESRMSQFSPLLIFDLNIFLVILPHRRHMNSGQLFDVHSKSTTSYTGRSISHQYWWRIHKCSYWQWRCNTSCTVATGKSMSANYVIVRFPRVVVSHKGQPQPILLTQWINNCVFVEIF